MKDYGTHANPGKNRIPLTDEDFIQFSEHGIKPSISELVKQTGLSYIFVYNIIHRRVKTISKYNYSLLFGKEAPVREPAKVDGTLFRNMVNLWLFLNDHVTHKDLFTQIGMDHVA